VNLIFAKIIIHAAAIISATSFFQGGKSTTSSFNPTKNMSSTAANMKVIPDISYLYNPIVTANIKLRKIAIPPRVGIGRIADDRSFGWSNNLNVVTTLITTGTKYTEIPKARKRLERIEK
jgi:hypothetical protein